MKLEETCKMYKSNAESLRQEKDKFLEITLQSFGECVLHLLHIALHNSGCSVDQTLNLISSSRRQLTGTETPELFSLVGPLGAVDPSMEDKDSATTHIVLDDFYAKMSAWRKAVETLHLVMQTDCILTNLPRQHAS
jgi:hypothetical protein